jgi:two-component system response regulator FixJ
MIQKRHTDSDCRPVVYIIDGDADQRDRLLLLLTVHELTATGYPSAAAFLAALAIEEPIEAPSCVVIDADRADVRAFELPERIRSLGKKTGVIILASPGDIEGAVAAVRAGAVDFIEKPCAESRLVESVRRALEAPGSQ